MKKLLWCMIIILSVTAATAQKTDVEKKLKEMGLELITPPKPVANYVRAVRTGNLVYLAGHGPTKADGSLITGKLGKEMTIE